MLSKLLVAKPKEFIEQVIGKDRGKYLTNFYVSNDLITRVEAQVQDIVNNSGSYLDLSTLIPSPFKDQDILDFCKLVGEGCRLLPNLQYLCSEKFIIRCLECFRLQSEELALKKLRSGKKPLGVEGAKKQQQSQKPSQPAKKGKGGAGKKKGKQQDSDNDEETKETTVEDQMDIVISEEDIKKTLLASDMAEFKDNKDEAEVLLESLAEFLVQPVNKQFQSIFIEAFERQSTKSQASSNKNLEAEVEEQFQLFQFIQKQLEFIRKTIEQKSDSDFETILAPVKAHYAKGDCNILLNKLMTI